MLPDGAVEVNAGCVNQGRRFGRIAGVMFQHIRLNLRRSGPFAIRGLLVLGHRILPSKSSMMFACTGVLTATRGPKNLR